MYDGDTLALLSEAYLFVISRPAHTLVLSALVLLMVSIVFGTIGASITRFKSGGSFAGFLLGFLLWFAGLLFCLLIPYKPIELIQKHGERRELFNRSLSKGASYHKRQLSKEDREELLRKLDERVK